MSVGSAHGSNTLSYWVRNSDPGTLGSITVGLHSGDPGSNGTASEFASTGTTPYTRGTAGTFATTSYNAGTTTASATASVAWSNCPAGTVQSASLWAGTTFILAGALTGGAQPVTAGNSFSLSALSAAIS